MTPPASENVTPSIQPALRGPFRFPLWAGEPKQPPLPPILIKSTECNLNHDYCTWSAGQLLAITPTPHDPARGTLRRRVPIQGLEMALQQPWHQLQGAR